MFDIGFTEVTLIAVIGLLVIGPERLPRVAREIGLWVGRLRRYVAQVRADIEREVRADELRELVNQPVQELKGAIKETEKSIKEEEKKLESDLNAGPAAASTTGTAVTATKQGGAAASPAQGAAASAGKLQRSDSTSDAASGKEPVEVKEEGGGSGSPAGATEAASTPAADPGGAPAPKAT